MSKVVLPSIFHPFLCTDLIRVGQDFDGGYLVSKTDILNSEVLIGLGINDDWSFEEDFARLNNCDLYAFDASVGAGKFKKILLRSLHKLYKPKIIKRAWRTYFGYKSFFSGNKVHFEQFVGLEYPPNHVGFDEVVKHVKGRKAFYKIDIDGSEYRILDQLAQRSSNMTGLVCEFHDCDLHLEKIIKFISEFNLPLVHVHANNYSPIADGSIPLVLELTFTSSDIGPDKIAQLPHTLDQPNTQKSNEIEIQFDVVE